MKKNYLLTLCGIFILAIGCFIVAFGTVQWIERNDISLPGDIDLWIGFAGALLGGVFTLMGVILTMQFQGNSDEEKIRLENMPILKFSVRYSTLAAYEMNGIFTLDGYEYLTTGFPDDKTKEYPIICIELANGKPAFDVYMESAITIAHDSNTKEHKSYAPAKYRLVADEKIKYMFWIKDYKDYETANVMGLIRIAYSDIFQNKYYQDIEFAYDRMVRNGEMLEINNVVSPIQCEDAESIYHHMKKQYADYFIKNQD